MSKPKFYITTAIPYANGAPHIGHAYERIATDAIARFKRLDGFDVLFVTGMDEHGQKMQQTAAREGITPQQLADRTLTLEKLRRLLETRRRMKLAETCASFAWPAFRTCLALEQITTGCNRTTGTSQQRRRP